MLAFEKYDGLIFMILFQTLTLFVACVQEYSYGIARSNYCLKTQHSVCGCLSCNICYYYRYFKLLCYKELEWTCV